MTPLQIIHNFLKSQGHQITIIDSQTIAHDTNPFTSPDYHRTYIKTNGKTIKLTDYMRVPHDTLIDLADPNALQQLNSHLFK